MKQTMKQEFPPGWNEKKVRAVIEYYDRQTEDEGAAEIDSAEEAPGETWISVPTKLIGAITRLIESHQRKTSVAGRRKSKSTTVKSNAGKNDTK
jgi:hypothetical protein